MRNYKYFGKNMIETHEIQVKCGAKSFKKKCRKTMRINEKIKKYHSKSGSKPKYT